MTNEVQKVFSFSLTNWQLDTLTKPDGKLSKMNCLASLIRRATILPDTYQGKRFSMKLKTGQVAISEVELAELWHCNRKTASRMIDLFNELGLISSVQNNRTSVHNVHCVERFTSRQAVFSNPFYRFPASRPQQT